MAKYLLTKHPEVLLGGDSLTSGRPRCRQFWEWFKYQQPCHQVFENFKGNDFETIIPICIHGDKGRTLKKSPIACYSWESVWGLPSYLRDTATEPNLNKKTHQKYDTGHLGATCNERSVSAFGQPEHCDPDGACTIKRRRLGRLGERYETHNSLGFLAGFTFSPKLFFVGTEGNLIWYIYFFSVGFSIYNIYIYI